MSIEDLISEDWLEKESVGQNHRNALSVGQHPMSMRQNVVLQEFV